MADRATIKIGFPQKDQVKNVPERCRKLAETKDRLRRRRRGAGDPRASRRVGGFGLGLPLPIAHPARFQRERLEAWEEN